MLKGRREQNPDFYIWDANKIFTPVLGGHFYCLK